MRSEGSPLDLNNLPDHDYTTIQHTSIINGDRKKKSEVKEEAGKVYECRFCFLKFCKSQALGGHMNRHRQERETETLNRARQLVFSNHNLALQPQPPHPPHLGPGYHTAGSGGVGGDPTLPLTFPTTLLPPHGQPYRYSSPSSRPSTTFPPYYHSPQTSINDYYVGHVTGNPSQCTHPTMNYGSSSVESSRYTCIGAPMGHAAAFGGGDNGRHGSSKQQQRLNVPASSNWFRDEF